MPIWRWEGEWTGENVTSGPRTNETFFHFFAFFSPFFLFFSCFFEISSSGARLTPPEPNLETKTTQTFFKYVRVHSLVLFFYLKTF